jgi:hypothetical protein
MRLLEVTEVLEVGHHVAQARRGEAKTAGSGKRAGADGFARRHMLHDDLAQDVAGSAVELISVKVEFLHIPS